jgi:pheophorbide a oxygenase
MSSQTPVLQQYYMPSSTDTLVSTLRKWMAQYGGQVPGQAASAAELPPEMSREAALDRYRQHTAECKDCQQVREWAPVSGRGVQEEGNLVLAVLLLPAGSAVTTTVIDDVVPPADSTCGVNSVM